MSDVSSEAGIMIKDGVSVIVPNSLALMTPYILYEQGDWFEDEIKFIRQYIKPGMNVLDIGANYGVYTLSIANIVGDKGKVWALEPTSSTFSCLEKSVAHNGFKNVSLLKLGLSNRAGSAQLYTSDNGELNSLTQDSVPTGSSSSVEEIELDTLDNCFSTYQWKDLAFIKLDAEGEEVKILEAAEKLLATLSPLIMFELKHGKTVNMPLVARFRMMGYETYRLIPGIGVLVPFDETQKFDDYLLNLFCCKKDRAQLLEEQGVLITQCDSEAPTNFDNAAEFILSNNLSVDMQDILSAVSEMSEVEDQDYVNLLSSYVAFRSNKYTKKEHLSFLMYALDLVKRLLASPVDDVGKLSTFSRIAFDAGDRSLGVSILNNVIQKYPDDLNFDLDAPFFPAHISYELVPHNNLVREWLFSSIIEKYIEKHAFSSYFTRNKTEPLFVRLQSLGFMSQPMSHRYDVLKKVFG